MDLGVSKCMIHNNNNNNNRLKDRQANIVER